MASIAFVKWVYSVFPLKNLEVKANSFVFDSLYLRTVSLTRYKLKRYLITIMLFSWIKNNIFKKKQLHLASQLFQDID